ncbi:SET domain-containing protein-lysine N-methyltransferase [Inquilinus limosus]|uniref:SET domain-containing protein n=1 Tax=Inquilinus limosus TaxID=171674 RepID=UPI003F1702C4
MLLVPTTVGPSRIEGLGLFAAAPMAAGTEVWRWHPVFDVFVPDAEIATLPEPARDYLERYAYPAPDLPGGLSLNLDDARFMNHSDDPTLETVGEVCIARRDIAAGEELTCDYGAFHPDLRDLIRAGAAARRGN